MKKAFLFTLPLFLTTVLFADGDPAPQAGRGSMWSTLWMGILALAFFYLILFRPEQKRRKKMQQQRNSLVKGARVTAMGIIGTVLRVEDKTVVLKMVDGNQIEMLKDAITHVEPAVAQQSAEATSGRV